MAILGNNVKGTGTGTALLPARLYTSKFTLATAQTMTELHGWFNVPSGSTCTLRLVIYRADGAGGNPGTLLAYSNILTLPVGDSEQFQTGFNVALAAGDYWIGFSCVTQTGSLPHAYDNALNDGFHAGLNNTASDPPPNPMGTATVTGTRNHSFWAVVGAPVSTPVADFTGTPTSGPVPLTVAFTDTSTNTPTSWDWDFGDGTAHSTAQNPAHSYTAVGTYTVTLIATNAGGSNTKVKTAYITVSNPAGSFSKIRFGTNLTVTDQGSGVIRVDGTHTVYLSGS